jgi:hypothetical protein
VSDPNYMHEFSPNRNDKCKSIVSGRICGMPVEYEAHTRYAEKKLKEGPRRRLLEDFDDYDVCESEDYDKLVICFNGVRAEEEMRQFVEDAIREKLESL